MTDGEKRDRTGKNQIRDRTFRDRTTVFEFPITFTRAIVSKNNRI
ncbi:hypothetical protein QUB70_05455 [Microcoleus sp. A003_D6]